MRSDPVIFRGLEEARGRFAPSGVTIGNFDGVHIGHQRLIARLRERCLDLGVKPSVVTFDPHPARVLAPARAPLLLSSLDQRAAWMGGYGIEQVLVIPFNLEFSRLEPEEFLGTVLAGAAGARVVVVGDNFRFGRNQAGGAGMLARLGPRLGYEAHEVAGVSFRGRMASSTAIRNLLEEGGVRTAARLLGRPYALAGCVAPGRGVGAVQTVPTLNLSTSAEVLPAPGVYVTAVRNLDSGERYESVTNIGFRPTYGGEDLSIESFILSGFSEPPPRRIEVQFFHRLREERKFSGAAPLKAQILLDSARARAWWRRRKRWVHHAGTAPALVY